MRIAGESLAIDKKSVPILETEQTPDQEPMIDLATQVLIQQVLYSRFPKEPPRQSLAIQQHGFDIAHQWPLIPGLIGGAESLLSLAKNLIGKDSLHRHSKEILPGQVFVAFRVFVPSMIDEITDGKTREEIHERVVEQGDTRFQRMGHAQLVFDDEEAMQKGLSFEVKHSVNRVFHGARSVEYPAKRLIGVVSVGQAQHVRREELGPLLLRDQAIPVSIGSGVKLLNRRSPLRNFVPPGIPCNDLIASCTLKHHLHKAAGQPGCVVIRVAHANSEVLDGPDDPRERPFQIPRMENHLVVFCLEQR